MTFGYELHDGWHCMGTFTSLSLAQNVHTKWNEVATPFGSGKSFINRSALRFALVIATMIAATSDEMCSSFV